VNAESGRRFGHVARSRSNSTNMSNLSNYPPGVTSQMVWDTYIEDRGPEFCAICGVADPRHLTNMGSARHPEEWCDTCLVENSENCGDWTDESVAAQQRLMPINPTA
jgi:hypothetical protein